MDAPWLCTGGKHVAPATGGSCPCGMVTRIPAPKRPPAGPPPEVLAMRAQYLDEWSQSLEAAASRVLRELEAAASRVLRELEAAASRVLREQADRLMAALSTTGRVLSAGDADRLVVVPRIEAAQPAALAYTAPWAAAAREVVTPALESARATLSAGVNRAPGEFGARRAEVAASATASSHNAGEADRLRPPASGGASAPPRPLQGGGRDRADGQGGKRARKKAGQKHRQQPSRAKRPLSADGVIHSPGFMPGDRPMGSPCIFEKHGPEALHEAA
jgi:hypothetical protein